MKMRLAAPVEMGTRRHFILSGARLMVAGSCGVLMKAEAAAPPTVLVLGDSLSAEYGLRRGSGWVALLAEKGRTEKPAFQVVNASISGDTTSGGRARLAPLLAQHKPQTIGQASRIQGITPAAISLLLIHLKRHNLSQAA